VLCEGACVLSHEGQKPIAVAALQRYATDEARKARIPLREAAPRNGLSVAVIGAGPAGLACAGELAARGFDVVVFDEQEEVGGIVRTAIAPYRQLVDPLPAERAALEQLSVRFRLGERITSGASLAALTDGADAIFLGVGLGEDIELNCPGTGLPGFWTSLPLIAALKRGEMIDLGNRVIVIGGGNTAIDVAREALQLGAAHVTLVYRRTRDEMPAYEFEVVAAEDEGVEFEWLAAPVEILGVGRVEQVRCARMRLGAPGEDGRRRPEPVEGEEFSAPRRHRRGGDRAAAARGGSRLARGDRDGPGSSRGRRRDRSHRPPTGLCGRGCRQRRSERRAGRRRREARRSRDRGGAAVPGLTEIRWHARAGQGAKTASQVLALALLRSGKSVQSFPEYGPERRGAPLRAFTRFDTRPVRRHDSVTEPNLVVVLDASLLAETSVLEGLDADTTVLVNADGDPPHVGEATVRAVPAARLAAAYGASFANVAMLGAVAAAHRRAVPRGLAEGDRRQSRQEVLAGGAVFRGVGGIRMAELIRWEQLPRAGIVAPEDAPQPLTGDWRTSGKPVVDYARCVNCLLCWLHCPDSAIVLDGTTLSGIEYDYCKGCELCVEVCPTDAITMVAEVTA